jgi:membrane protein implicated in regulation of membrane protease activity
VDWLDDSQWLWWLAVALAAGVIEVATVDFVFLMVVGGSLIASISAAIGLPFAVQVIIFGAATLALLVTVRPPLKRWAQTTPHTPMGTRALVGQQARVLEPVSDRGGLVKLGGEVWTARATAGNQTFEVGSTVYVVRIEGATAVVATAPLAGGPQSLEGRP